MLTAPKHEMPGSNNEENSPNISNTTIEEELQDDECIQLETLPHNECAIDDKPTAVKKKGKKPMCGKN
jgi:hypothetical protein